MYRQIILVQLPELAEEAIVQNPLLYEKLTGPTTIQDGTLKILLKCRTEGARQEIAETLRCKEQRICGNENPAYPL